MAAPSSADLAEFIDKSRSFCLNEKRTKTHGNVFMAGTEATLESDADAQLLLFIPFRETVKLTHISLTAANLSTQPTTLKIFVNKTSFGFDDVEDSEPAQIIALKPTELAAGEKIALRAVRFTSVQSVHLFLDNESDGAETSEIANVSFFGVTVMSTASLTELKKSTEDGA